MIYAIILAIFSSVVSTFSAKAAEFLIIESQESPAYDTMYMRGAIVPGDFRRFVSTIKNARSAPTKIFLDSPGGDFAEAIMIATAVRSLSMGTESPLADVNTARRRKSEGIALKGRARELLLSGKIDDAEYHRLIQDLDYDFREPENYPALCSLDWQPFQDGCDCSSACALIWASGVNRTGAIVRLHRPYFVGAELNESTYDDFSELHKQLFDQYVALMLQFGMPRGLIEKSLTYSRTSLMDLPWDQVKALEWEPVFFEFIFAKCTGRPADCIILEWSALVNRKRSELM